MKRTLSPPFRARLSLLAGATLVVASVLLSGAARAEDIVTMPSANQFKKGEVDVAAYYLNLVEPKGAPRFVQYQTVYMGLTDRFELDVHRTMVDRDKTSAILVGSYKILSENKNHPDLVIGARNFTGEKTTNSAAKYKSDNPSFYLAAATTFFNNPEKPGAPLVRVHYGIGTADWTIMGEKRHEGAFGGLQFLFAPWLGAVAEYDGQDFITDVSLISTKTHLTLKGGSYGKHSWYGLAYRMDLF